MTIFFSNLKRILRDKGNFIVMFLVPIVFITLIMVGSTTKNETTIGIADLDKTRFSKELTDVIKQKSDVRIINESDIKKYLVNMNIDYAIVIDRGFTNDIINNKNSELRGYSIKESNVSLPAKYYIESYLNSARNIGAASKGNADKFYEGLGLYKKGSFSVSYADAEKTKDRTSKTLYGLGFLVMGMLFMSSNATQLILEDKKNKTFFRIFSSPITAKSYMLQNVLSAFTILLIQVAAIFAIMTTLFKADFGPSLISMFGLFAIFSLVCVAFGVAIASISKDARQAGAISTLLTVPMCMLGGCYWPRSLMPKILIDISNFVPTTWILKASDRVLHGGSLIAANREISIILLFALVFILLGSWRKADITK